MLAEERRQLISDWAVKEGVVDLTDLGGRLGVSAMTVRRDLDALEEKGVLRRVRGGAVAEKIPAAPHTVFPTRENEHKREKEAIARYAVDHFVHKHDVVVMEGGTTVSCMARFFNVPGVTVVTNGLMIVNRLAPLLPDIEVMCCGGILRQNTFTFVGPQAEEFLKGIRAPKCFLSGTGLTVEDGVADIDVLEAEIKRALASSARERILLVDSSKFGKCSLRSVLSLAEFQVLVTDAGAPHDVLDEIRAMGIEVHIA